MGIYQQATVDAVYAGLAQTQTQRGGAQTSLVFSPACSSVCVTQDGKMWSQGKVPVGAAGPMSFDLAMTNWHAKGPPAAPPVAASAPYHAATLLVAPWLNG